MNVVITLPINLIRAIKKGRKTLEMRKSFPRLLTVGEDGFFVVEKGSNKIHCWCRVDNIQKVSSWIQLSENTCRSLAISQRYIDNYRSGTQFIYLWRIGKVINFEDGAVALNDLYVGKAPQSFAYCPCSYGESY